MWRTGCRGGGQRGRGGGSSSAWAVGRHPRARQRSLGPGFQRPADWKDLSGQGSLRVWVPGCARGMGAGRGGWGRLAGAAGAVFKPFSVPMAWSPEHSGLLSVPRATPSCSFGSSGLVSCLVPRSRSTALGLSGPASCAWDQPFPTRSHPPAPGRAPALSQVCPPQCSLRQGPSSGVPQPPGFVRLVKAHLPMGPELPGVGTGPALSTALSPAPRAELGTLQVPSRHRRGEGKRGGRGNLHGTRLCPRKGRARFRGRQGSEADFVLPEKGLIRRRPLWGDGGASRPAEALRRGLGTSRQGL